MATEKKKKLVICGITGSQGGAVYQAFMEGMSEQQDHWHLTGVTRNVKAAKEKFLARNKGGGKQPLLVEADFLNLDSLRKAFQDADYVFALTQPWNDDYTVADVEGEIQQGKNIVQACIDCQVKHLIFSASAHGMLDKDDNNKTGIPHVDSKIEVEEFIKQQEGHHLSYTILQPVQFADNIGKLQFFPIQPGNWIRSFVDGDAIVPYVACRDIGLLTRAILLEGSPSSYAGQSIYLLGDLVSGDELAVILTELRRSSSDNNNKNDQEEVFRYYAVSRWILWFFAKEFYKMRVFFETFGRDPVALEESRKQIAYLKTIVPELSSVKDHLRREGWADRDLSSSTKKSDNNSEKGQILPTVAATAAAVAVVASLVAIRRWNK